MVNRLYLVSGISAVVLIVLILLYGPSALGFFHKAYNPELSALYKALSPRFKVEEYVDPKTGLRLQYNIALPDGYDPRVKYPLVVFIHDSSVVSDDVSMTLKRDYGPLLLARDSQSGGMSAIVVAPQYSAAVADDQFNLTPQGQATLGIIDNLRERYSVNSDRILLTGQSMGCMTSFALNIERPNYFAGTLCVAGQWNPERMATVARERLLYIVSEADEKASPGMDAFENVAERQGILPAKATWDGTWSQARFAEELRRMDQPGINLLFVKMTKGTVLPRWVPSNGMFEHIYTWDKVYAIDSVRAWLLAQRRK